MPADWKATLCAVDGDTTQGIARQVLGIPPNASYIFVSVGGNDALMNMDLLTDITTPGPLLLSKLSMLADVFDKNYDTAISDICKLRKPTYVCTIYGNLESSISKAAKAAIGVYNDIIYSRANENHLGVIDLRKICNQPSDYANPIEPSVLGGRKIADAIYQKVVLGRKHLSRE